MNLRLILLSHGRIAEALLAEARTILGGLPIEPVILSINGKLSAQLDRAALNRRINALGSKGREVLILADLQGATPCNCAAAQEARDCTIVTGLNLPMLLRVMNYAGRPLAELAGIAREGGQAGIQVQR